MIREILKTVPRIGYSVSYSTRVMRVGEQNGKDYFFITKSEFLDLIGKDEFLEYAEVHGNFYGTSLKQVELQTSAGNDVILEIDVQGAEIIQRKMPEALSIFILPPSFEVLRNRLTARNTESVENLALRLKNSFDEVRQFDKFDYIVINNEIERAARDLEMIILAERLKRNRQTDTIQGILDSFVVSKTT